jgi:Na+-transporting methylmalonyl-CoA/oxaloacetate decarboxylase gamma subunit
MKKICILLLLGLTIAVAVSSQQTSSVCFNEVLVINDENFVDDYGSRNGWIELYNTSPGTVNLAGCYLTNDRANPTKYPIPKGDVLTKILPRQHTLFWADGKAYRGTFHMNFELDPDGENYLALYDVDGKTLIDEVLVPVGQEPDVSYGRLIDGRSEWGILSKVTPSTNNKTLDTNERIEKFKSNDSLGIGMTLTAMLVVFIGLIVLYLSFRGVGGLAIRATRYRAHQSGHVGEGHNVPASGEVFAAIAAALYEVENDVHDLEDTVLTIHRVARTYSPWSSKIYGLRDNLKK